MALTTYTELRAALADMLHKTSLTSQIVDFITLVESEINADTRLRLMEVDETVTLTAGTRTIALPSRYIEPILLELVISGQSNTELIWRTPGQMPIDASAGSATRPSYWTVNGDTIEFPNLSDATYTLRFRMLKGFDLASTSTNALLTAYPGLYLYGAAMHGGVYMVNDKRVATWEKMYNRLLAKVKRKESRNKTLNKLLSDHPSAGRLYTRNIYQDGV